MPKSRRPAREYRSSAVYLFGGLNTHGTRPNHYITGAVPTPHGYVSVYSQGLVGGSDWDPSTTWRFIYDDTQHELVDRTHRLTERGIVRIARRFAGAVVYGWPIDGVTA